ncbi:MAG: PAS domain S-box protein [Gemmataceae bacterium]
MLTQLANAVNALAERTATTFVQQRVMGQALQADEARLRFQTRLLDTVGQVVLAADPAGRISYVNRAAARLFGQAPAALLGRPLAETAFAPADRAVAAEVMRHVDGGETWAGELPLCRADGSTFLALFTYDPLVDDQGRPAGGIGVAVDLTDRERAARDVAERETLLRGLLDHTPNMVYIEDLQNRLLFVNRRFEEALGCTRRQAVGRSLHELFDPATATAFAARAQQVVATGTLQQVIERVSSPTGGEQVVLSTRFPLSHADGTLYAVCCITRDITEQKRAEEKILALNGELERRVVERTGQLEQANRDLQTEVAEHARAADALRQVQETLRQRSEALSLANAEMARAARLKDEFLASMSHELRTPLHAILGMAEALHEQVYGPLTDPQRDAVRQVEDSGRHLLSLINDILDLSKIEAGKVQLHPGPTAVADVCQASLRMVREPAHKKRLKTECHLDPTVGLIETDGRRLKQVLVNLLSNAVKFTPEGGTVGLRVSGDPERGVVAFEVSDTGIGIRPDDLGRLFRPFTQLDGRLSRQYAGTGLGLALVHRVVELHGGGVAVESEPGKGSRFTVVLPWSPTAAADEAGLATATADEAAPAGCHRVLLAEDNEATARVVADYLRSRGYAVSVAREGMEAVERAREEQPDLVLMDIHLPGTDGLQAIRLIRATPHLQTVPVIAVTALAMAGDRERCLQAGATDYVCKPIGLRDLAAVIRPHLTPGERGAVGGN